MQPKLILETPRLTLRELTSSDTDDLFGIIGDADTMTYYPSPFTKEESGNWIAKSIRNYSERGHGLWAVILKAENKFIGQCGITIQDIDGSFVPEIGYHINKHYHKKGFATEASLACLKYGFENLELPEIFIHTWVKNIPSQRVAERSGLIKIKIYDKYISSHDLTWPHIVYSLKADEYEK